VNEAERDGFQGMTSLLADWGIAVTAFWTSEPAARLRHEVVPRNVTRAPRGLTHALSMLTDWGQAGVSNAGSVRSVAMTLAPPKFCPLRHAVLCVGRRAVTRLTGCRRVCVVMPRSIRCCSKDKLPDDDVPWMRE
jgi:hypothetical protein